MAYHRQPHADHHTAHGLTWVDGSCTIYVYTAMRLKQALSINGDGQASSSIADRSNTDVTIHKSKWSKQSTCRRKIINTQLLYYLDNECDQSDFAADSCKPCKMTYVNKCYRHLKRTRRDKTCKSTIIGRSSQLGLFLAWWLSAKCVAHRDGLISPTAVYQVSAMLDVCLGPTSRSLNKRTQLMASTRHTHKRDKVPDIQCH